ncbi:MAG: DUF2232 domain-containing protein [Ruminococcaceae bacterium]|nr:DUF2232 domain-containing protein [Oscillospiraceae bacterium]
MNIYHKKSYLLSALAVALFSYIYCMTGGAMQFFAGVVLSSVIGISVTKHHYIFVGVNSALCVAVLTIFHGISGGVLGAMAGLTAGVIIVLMGIGLGLSSNLSMSISKTVIMCSLIYLANMLIGFFALGREIPFDMIISEMKNVYTELIKTQYADVSEITQKADEIVGGIMGITVKFMPSVLICLSGIFGLAQSYVYRVMLPIFNKNAKIESFSMLRAERTVGILFIVVCIALFITENLLICDALLNLVVIMGFVFYVCGLSYIDFSMKHKGKNKTYRSIMIIVVIPSVTMFFSVGAVIVAGIGLFDSYADFRKRKDFGEGENGNE